MSFWRYLWIFLDLDARFCSHVTFPPTASVKKVSPPSRFRSGLFGILDSIELLIQICGFQISLRNCWFKLKEAVWSRVLSRCFWRSSLGSNLRKQEQCSTGSESSWQNTGGHQICKSHEKCTMIFPKQHPRWMSVLSHWHAQHQTDQASALSPGVLRHFLVAFLSSGKLYQKQVCWIPPIILSNDFELKQNWANVQNKWRSTVCKNHKTWSLKWVTTTVLSTSETTQNWTPRHRAAWFMSGAQFVGRILSSQNATRSRVQRHTVFVSCQDLFGYALAEKSQMESAFARTRARQRRFTTHLWQTHDTHKTRKTCFNARVFWPPRNKYCHFDRQNWTQMPAESESDL